mmetsp:Transcript_65994/g.148304  ORF Transcript_65994/g.148304 Transcript_65994/m.148304 type:complete len:236 (-) Transcript_65994:33-740(-)
MARIHVVLLFLTMAVTGTDAEAFPTDGISMLHVDIKLHRSAVASNTSDVGADAAACQCLNWKQTYESRLVKCGAAFDVGFCDLGLFLNFDHKYCINAEMATGPQQKVYPGSWCYVSSQCQTLRGGTAINSDISFKMCTKEDDDTLGELPPAELFALSEHMVPPGDGQMMVLMAYDWAGPADGEGTLLTVQGSLDPQTPVVGASLKFDTFTAVYGKEVWEVWDGPRGQCMQGCPSA